MRVSVVIPAHNEEKYLSRCIASIRESAIAASIEVEIVVVANRCTDSTPNLARSLGAVTIDDETQTIAGVRNRGVKSSSGEIIITIDADSWMYPTAISEIIEKLNTHRFVGGGSFIRPERLSFGIVCTLIWYTPLLLQYRVSAGMFWFYRSSFDAIGGFNESLVSAEDLDFAVRLKRYDRVRDLRFGTVSYPGIFTSCRKFDQFGDWYLLKHPDFVRRLLSGRDREAANFFYYNVR